MDLPIKIAVYKRLNAEGRWKEAEPIRDALMKEARKSGKDKAAAQDWAYTELNKRFPPPGSTADQTQTDNANQPDNASTTITTANDTTATTTTANTTGDVQPSANPVDEPSSPRSARVRDLSEPSVIGLGDLPAGWPDLPPNAPLTAEVSWVQANRLRCVRETSDRIVVDLSRAISPAPSYAALGWLETSIKTYAKFVDVAAKATASNDGDQAEIRREQQSIEEVRKLLAEMLVV